MNTSGQNQVPATDRQDNITGKGLQFKDQRICPGLAPTFPVLDIKALTLQTQDENVVRKNQEMDSANQTNLQETKNGIVRQWIQSFNHAWESSHKVQ